MIPDDIVDRVRDEADIVGIVGEFVKLKRVGNSFRGPCPFHHGKDANFAVTVRGGYKCFVCGESGDVFSFVQKHLGLDFVESVKWVGAKVGVDVREVSKRVDDRDAREPLWEVHGTVAAFFTAQLWESSAGAAAREYLSSRAISRADADRFGLGYAPRDGRAMREYLTNLGFDDARQTAAGLLVQREDRPELAPRFRDRLMFPIFDVAGHIAGFGGRVLGDLAGRPKYLNSAESEIFSKRNLLYGLNWAKQAVRKAERLVIVEGYFDVIRLVLAGIHEVVAPLGTALTDSQAALIRKYTKTVFVLYDSDRAGLRATFRAGDELLSNEIAVRVITLPEGEDPDTFVAKVGAEGFERAAAASVDVFDRKIQILERGGWFADLRRKRQALDKLLPTIRVTADRLLRDLYLTRTSEVAGVSREMLERELRSGSSAPDARRGVHDPTSAIRGRNGSADAPVRRGERRRDHWSRGVRAERELVRTLLHQRMLLEPVRERVGADIFTHPAFRQIFARLVDVGPEASVEDLARDLDENATAVLQELLMDTGGLGRSDQAVDDSVNALLARDIHERLMEIDRLLPLATSDEKDDLIREKQRLAAEIQGLGRPRWKSFGSPRP